MVVVVGVVSPHLVLGVGLRELLAGLTPAPVVHLARTPPELRGEAPRFDLTLLDAHRGDVDTLTGDTLALRSVSRRVLLLTTPQDAPGAIRAALRAGACGTLGKAALPGEVRATVQAALRGELTTPEVAEPGDELSLTGREMDVLRLYGAGRTCAETARALGVSQETVRDHVRRVRARHVAAGRPAPTRLELHHLAVEAGLPLAA